MIRYLITWAVLLASISSKAQSSSTQTSSNNVSAEKVSTEVLLKARKFEKSADKQIQKVLKALCRQEQKMKAKLAKHHPAAADSIFLNSSDRIKAFTTPVSKYNGYLDTLQSSLHFLNTAYLSGKTQEFNESVVASLQGAQQLQDKLRQLEEVKAYIRERQYQLKQQLSQYAGFRRHLQKINKQAYYYGQQINEYKEILRDRKKAEARAMDVLKKLPAYQDFIKKHSQLASLFNTPAIASMPGTESMQSRSLVEQLIMQRINTSISSATGNMNANSGSFYIQEQLAGASSQINEVRNKIGELGNGGEMEMPNFKPNTQRTKNFFQRLELSCDIQTQQGNNLLPSVANLGLSAGYRLNDKSVAGIGAAYRLGLGSPIKDITFSHQGISLRSFVDLKMKNSFWISGGFEYNHMNAFRRFSDLYNIPVWQQSGLIGITRKYKAGKKEARMQLLWDFLSYRQTPRAPALKFRIGFNLK